MTTLELNAELLRELSTIINDEPMLRRVLTAIKAMKKEKKANSTATPPCAYTVKEVKQRLALTRDDALHGRGISEEEAERMMEEML